MRNGTVLVWDMAALAPSLHPHRVRLAEQQAEALWADLAHSDPKRARSAARALAAAPADAVAFVRGRVAPTHAAIAARVAELVEKLGSDTYAVRRDAERGLAELHERAVLHLQLALRDKLDLEQRLRIRRLLRGHDDSAHGSARLRELRVVEALERMATPAAVALLRSLTKAPAEARVALEARMALARLEGQKKK